MTADQEMQIEAILKLSKARPKRAEGANQRQNLLKQFKNNICTRTSIVLITTKTTYSQERLSAVHFELDEFDLQEDSLLLHIFRGLPCPTRYDQAVRLRTFLYLHKQHAEVREIIRTPVGNCKRWELPRLMMLIEDHISTREVEYKSTLSAQTRGILRDTQATYADGSPMGVTSFKSRFPNDKPNTSRRSMKLVEKTKMALLDKPFLEDFNSFEERNDKFLKSLVSTRDDLFALCDKIFEDYERTKEAINAAADLGMPDLEDPALQKMVRRKPKAFTFLTFRDKLRALTPDEQLRTFATFSRVNGFAFVKHKFIDVTGIPLLRTNASADSMSCMFEILVSTHYLPTVVVLACLFAIIAETSWNPETALSLTSKDIVVRGNKYFIVGVKGKVNSLQTSEIEDAKKGDENSVRPDSEITEKTAITAIKLLLSNESAISQWLGISDNRLFVTIDRHNTGPMTIKRLPVIPAMAAFFKKFPYEPFQLGALRKLGAHIDYLFKGGDIFTTQALLGHADPETTKIYLDSSLFPILLEANTRRCMRKMEATELFVCGRGDKLAERGLSDKDIQPLLFPASPSSNARSVADEWIRGAMSEFKVGVAELQHCAYQFHFYQKNFRKLVEENPVRFYKVHFPRLVFSSALRKVILASPHARLIKEYERQLK